MQDAGDGVGVGDDLEDAHAGATFSAAGDVEREDAGEDSAGSLERAKSSGSCGGGGGAAGLGMMRSRRRWWLANTP